MNTVHLENQDKSGLAGRLLRDEKLQKYTSWRVGGCVDRMYFPAHRQDLVNFLKTIPADEQVFWMGMGSNLLVRDGGIRGTVINTRGCLKQLYREDDGRVYVEAGVQCARVARFCGSIGLSGAEFLAGIPGTMGGALKMNAGAFGAETWGIIAAVDMVDKKGASCTRGHDEFAVSYRSVQGPADECFLAAHLQLPKDDSGNSRDRVKELLTRRSQTQPISQLSCGSVFRNPEGDHAARLIDASGLKGYRIGGAYVSEKHANFIINDNSASAADIESLIDYVKEQVAKKQGVQLQTEVCIVGEADVGRMAE